MHSETRRPTTRPPPELQCQVWLDFDGTVTREDVLDQLILRYSVDESWRDVERRWQNGEIGSRQCLADQFDLLRVTPEQVEALLDGMTFDPGVGSLIGLLESRRVPVTVLSDSVDFFIRRILDRLGLGHVPIRSNTAVFRSGGLQLLCPHENPRCSFGAAHCKCRSMEALGRSGRRSIYVGDGRSDLCAARKADFVFAKRTLADCLSRESLPYIRYSSLHDVAQFLADAWQSFPAWVEPRGLEAYPVIRRAESA